MNNVTHNTRARGFSFVEILFAVMILGIGFIMLAAMFPVAIVQQQATIGEANAQAVARGVMQSVQAFFDPRLPSANPLPVSSIPIAPAVATVEFTAQPPAAPFTFDPFFSSRVIASDPRFAWAPLYQKDPATLTTAKLYVFVLKSSVNERYTSGDVTTGAINPKLNTAMLNYQDAAEDDAQTIEFTGVPLMAAEGCFVVARVSGRVYRLGSRSLTNPAKYAISPDRKMASTAENGSIQVWMVGRYPVAGVYEGGTQDLELFEYTLEQTP